MGILRGAEGLCEGLNLKSNIRFISSRFGDLPNPRGQDEVPLHVPRWPGADTHLCGSKDSWGMC